MFASCFFLSSSSGDRGLSAEAYDLECAATRTEAAGQDVIARAVFRLRNRETIAEVHLVAMFLTAIMGCESDSASVQRELGCWPIKKRASRLLV